MPHTPLDTIWVLIAGILVFMMQAGFMCLEVGLVRQKNSINVAIKNVTDFLVSSISFFFIGFGFMFGTSFYGLIGTDGWLLAKYVQLDQQGWIYTFWFFQVVFCGAAATIVSGGVAERMRFSGYIIISLMISTLIYPVFGHWAWGGNYDLAPAQGWLAALGYKDFAGSSVVHMVGGVTTLACLSIMGPRKGRYNPDGTVNKVWGCDIPMSTLGLFLLWFGWFGFNGGSTLAANKDVALIIINTNLAACTGGLSCLYFTWRQTKNLNVQSIINGCLGGLVAITASCAYVTPVSALIIGFLAGPVLIIADKFLDKFHIDDAVGAVPVHGACGLLGVLCVGFFAEPQYLVHHSRWDQIIIQTLGAVVCFAFTFGTAWTIIKLVDRYITQLRVSSDDEERGLNISEHGARTVWYDLVEDMHHIEKNNDLSKRTIVEPTDETSVVASMFNKLMDSLEQKVKELKDAQGQLVQSEKLASIGQLAAGVAHEINNPVGFISNNMEVLEQYIADYGRVLRMVESLKKSIEAGDTEKAKLIAEEMTKFEQEINFDYVINDIGKLLQHNQRGLERIRKIVLDLRTFAREGQDKLEAVKIEEVIDSILNIVHSELKYKAELKKSYSDTPLLNCNAQRLGQVFINLFVNAAQAIEERGIIEVKTYRENGYVCVDVADTGKGILPENLKKIFDPFFTTKPVGQGTGLGLSVSYEIVKKHGGEIKVRSKLGEGTTFTVMLPLSESKGQ